MNLACRAQISKADHFLNLIPENMQQHDSTNQYFDMAVQFVNQTAKHLFLTGKAGTGKTTFLKHIKESSPKRLAIIAPTGVAAINAGGVTIHSFFQLPFGSFLPSLSLSEYNGGNFFNRQSLLKHLKLNKAKRELMQELELLIIDEVSMVRADMLDAIDTVLRYVRRQPDLPFGGVQMLFIGDLFQLAPVVKEAEWKTLQQYYDSPFFFHAQVLQQAPPLYLELKKIYRQRDETFIRLLNKLRHNQVGAPEIELLQQYYRPDFKPEKKGEYIVLTTHNAKADVINQEELDKLPGKLHIFKAVLEGEFSENALPAEMKLQVKEGAQIMFIRNDKGDERRYFNGKTGTISRIRGEKIYVVFPGEAEELLVEKESWKNLRYSYNNETEQVEERVKGTFTQYPIRLAWAITIHKSQGLTFNKAIVDAGSSFAPGQVYVALSRLSSLEGLVLHSPIHAGCISTDVHASSLSGTEPDSYQLQQQLQEAQKEYLHASLLTAFSWQKLRSRLETFKESLSDRRIPLLEAAIAMAGGFVQNVVQQQIVAEKFSRQLEQLLPAAARNGYRQVHERIEAAVTYFTDTLRKELLLPLQQHIDQQQAQKKKPKKFLKDLKELKAVCEAKARQLEQIRLISLGLMEGSRPGDLLVQMQADRSKAAEEIQEQTSQEVPKKKAAKGETQRISLEMFRQGMSVSEIAAERGFVNGTIEGHLASFIPTGEVALEELVSPDKIMAIQQVLEESDEELNSSAIREILGEEYGYGEIKAVISHWQKMQATADTDPS
jgi:hypothetical protein